MPMISRTGDTHDKSKLRTCATKVVLTSAPIITAMDALRVIMPFFAKDVVSKAVAVELCRSAVTAAPDRKAEKRLPVPFVMICRSLVPKARLKPCLTRRVAHNNKQTAPAI